MSKDLASNQMLSGWGNFPMIAAQYHEPKLEELHDFESISSLSCRGNGRSYGDSSLNPNTIYSALNLNKFESFDPRMGIVVAQAGVLLSEILDIFMPRGFFLSVTPGTKFVSLGGAVASDVHGKDHHVTGTFSSHVLFIDVLTAQQGVVRASRKENSELFFATIGGMGLTGLILRVAIKLKSIPSPFIRQITYKCGNLSEIMQRFEENQGIPYSVAWIDCLNGKEKSLGRSLFMAGDFVAQDDLPQRFKAANLTNSPEYQNNLTTLEENLSLSAVSETQQIAKLSNNTAIDLQNTVETPSGSLLGCSSEVQERQEQRYHKLVVEPMYCKYSHPKSVPFFFPSWVLNNLSMRLFNTLYYHKALKTEAQTLVTTDTFFYPLDAILNWNRIYGIRGFTQYQFVIPKDNAEQVISSILKQITQSHKGSFLSVLKLFGEHNHTQAEYISGGKERSTGGYLSFPMSGYTLALDFAIEPDLFKLLARLDEEVIEAGGRIYLAKDVRLSAQNFRKMYGSAVDTFLNIKQRYDPDNKFSSLQAQRLGLIV